MCCKLRANLTPDPNPPPLPPSSPPASPLPPYPSRLLSALKCIKMLGTKGTEQKFSPCHTTIGAVVSLVHTTSRGRPPCANGVDRKSRLVPGHRSNTAVHHRYTTKPNQRAAAWCGGAVVLRCCDVVVLWCCGAVVLLYRGALLMVYSGFVVLWFCCCWGGTTQQHSTTQHDVSIAPRPHSTTSGVVLYTTTVPR